MPRRSKNVTPRHYSFTWNNYPDDFKAKLTHWFKERKMRYMVGGQEIGESGTPHIQGHFWLRTQATISALQKQLKKLEIHMSIFEIKSTPAKSIEYCKKDGAFFELGEPPKQGQRTDLEEMMAAVREDPHKREITMMEEFPMVLAKYSSFYARYKLLVRAEHLKDLDWKDGSPPNYWIYGPPGAGKSRVVRQRYKNVYSKAPNKWWDGYDGQDVVLIEDVEPKHECLSWFFKIWFDRYKFVAQIKNSSIAIRPPAVIATSNYTIEQIFGCPEVRRALERRFIFISTEDPEWGSILPPTSEVPTSEVL